jgi:hypothetical protein
MGGGGGMGRQYQSPAGTDSPLAQNGAGRPSAGQELDQLKEQAAELKRQMDAIQSKIRELA